MPQNSLSNVKTLEEKQPFLSDVKQLRERAQASIGKGAVTPNYRGNIAETLEILQSVLATELVCSLRYTMNAIAASGINSESVKDEFAEHAREELEHAKRVAERMSQLGGRPDFNPDSLTAKSASQYVNAHTLIDMIKENLIAERIACEHYRELAQYFADKDPTTRVMIESILEKEEEHASDMHDLLVAHQGHPMLSE